MKAGIENGLKLVKGLGALGAPAEAVVVADGVIPKLRALVPLAFDGDFLALVGLNLPQLKLELADLDDAEKASLVAAFKEKFNLADDAAEAKFEAALGLVLKAEELALEISGFVKALKAPVPAPAPAVEP